MTILLGHRYRKTTGRRHKTDLPKGEIVLVIRSEDPLKARIESSNVGKHPRLRFSSWTHKEFRDHFEPVEEAETR